MWSRVVEIMLGCWLLISPFVFGYPAENASWWYWDMGSGTIVILLALLSWLPATRRAHLGTVLVSLVLIGSACARGWSSPEISTAVQNDASLGLMLIMFAVIPCNASAPPAGWRTRAAGPSGV